MDEGRYLVLLRKDTDGQWRVSHDVGNSSLPMPTPMPMPMPPVKKDGK
jgi:ketosteroid isomerase-like protein